VRRAKLFPTMMSSPPNCPSSLQYSLLDTTCARRENPWMICSYFSTVFSPSSSCLSRHLFPSGAFLINRENASVFGDLRTRFFLSGLRYTNSSDGDYLIPSGCEGSCNLMASVSDCGVSGEVLVGAFCAAASKDLEAFRFLISDELANESVGVTIRPSDKT
jgi:hypothetical protein